MNQPPQITEHLNSYAINAFIDGELPANELQGTEQHLTTCHACTLRVLSATQLKAATARAGNRFAPPPEALGRLAAQLRSQSQLHTNPQSQTNPQPETKTSARLYSIRPAAWASLAAAILLTISLLSWRQLHQTNALAAELLDQHLATLSSAAAPQVISSDRHTVKPWFQGRVPFSFNLPDTAALPSDTILKGADLTYLNGQPAALLLFTIHKHEVSIFLTQRSTNPTFSTLSSTRAGFTIHTATTPDLRIVAVSDVNPADLDNLLAVLVQIQKPA
jgi:anti-sigma factor RsiW